MKKSEYHKLIDRALKPKLTALGFKEFLLGDCICPEVLYGNGRLWFGTSWDYRDQYLEVALGHLYWFADVMPRVIVLGDYSYYVTEAEGYQPNKLKELSEVVEAIDATIEKAISIYKDDYDRILKNYLQSAMIMRNINCVF